MRVVLYDDETMEPLTVITIPMWAHERLRAGEPIQFPVWRSLLDAPIGPATIQMELPLVRVWFEEFLRHGQRHWFCFTRDGENAIQLRSVFLAGQTPAVLEREREAFSRGLIAALWG